jgi:uncharacterized membrane protein YwaF
MFTMLLLETPAPAAFVHYGWDHWLALLSTAAAAAACALALRRAEGGPREVQTRRWVLGMIAAVAILCAVIEHACDIHRGCWSPATALPLQLCDIALWTTVFAALRYSRAAHPREILAQPVGWIPNLYELSYYWGWGGTLQAMLTPDLKHPFPTFEYFQFFIMHAVILIGVVAMTNGLRLRPRPASLSRIIPLTIAVAAVVLGINALTGGNYMYLARNPDRPSLLDHFGPRPWALLTMVAVGAVIFTLAYLPYVVLDWWRGRRRSTGISG